MLDKDLTVVKLTALSYEAGGELWLLRKRALGRTTT